MRGPLDIIGVSLKGGQGSGVRGHRTSKHSVNKPKNDATHPKYGAYDSAIAEDMEQLISDWREIGATHAPTVKELSQTFEMKPEEVERYKKIIKDGLD